LQGFSFKRTQINPGSERGVDFRFILEQEKNLANQFAPLAQTQQPCAVYTLFRWFVERIGVSAGKRASEQKRESDREERERERGGGGREWREKRQEAVRVLELVKEREAKIEVEQKKK